MSLLLAVVFGVVIGVSLGALGGGGSILTVPVLVYALGQDARAATTGSLVIVGITSAAAAVGHARSGRVRWTAGVVFGLVGVVASFAGTALNAHVSPKVILACFAALMLVAAAGMFAKTRGRATGELEEEEDTALAGASAPAQVLTRPQVSTSWLGTALKVLAAGLVVGFLTGFLGVGGGFVIVPALVLALRYEMPVAIGTSLLVISLNSAVALLARAGQGGFHWAVIAPFTVAAIAGSLAGKRVADRLPAAALTRAFAVLLVLVAGYVLVRVTLVS